MFSDGRVMSERRNETSADINSSHQNDGDMTGSSCQTNLDGEKRRYESQNYFRRCM